MTGTDTRGGWALSVWCVTAAFGAYFCMYGFRSPFTAGSYAEPGLWEIQTKTLLVTAQVLGYALSKVIGIKVIAEMPAGRRIRWLIGLIAVGEVSLLLFALTPAPLNCVFLFFNGLPLGMVFGLVLGFLEGRRHTEALTAGLCASFIVAGGVTKTVGALILAAGVTEAWMPFWAGMTFVLPLLFSRGCCRGYRRRRRPMWPPVRSGRRWGPRSGAHFSAATPWDCRC